jgi:hypothetical protein
MAAFVFAGAETFLPILKIRVSLNAPSATGLADANDARPCTGRLGSLASGRVICYLSSNARFSLTFAPSPAICPAGAAPSGRGAVHFKRKGPAP